MLLLHPAAELSWTNFTVHASTVIGIAALGALYAWRAHRGPSLSDRFPVNADPTTSTPLSTSRRP